VGLLKTAAKVAVASSVHGRVQRRQGRRWAQQDAQNAPSAPPGVAGGAPDVAQQIALIGQLNELRQAGGLTDAEFEAKKAQILGT
jgi:transposase-like protein